MYGFNIGVDMTYEQVTSMLFKGANVYASRRSRHIDIIQTEDFSDSFIRTIESHDKELDKVTQEADAYLYAVDRGLPTQEVAQPRIPTIPIIPTDNYDFASMYGLSVSKPEDKGRDEATLEDTESFKEDAEHLKLSISDGSNLGTDRVTPPNTEHPRTSVPIGSNPDADWVTPKEAERSHENYAPKNTEKTTVAVESTQSAEVSIPKQSSEAFASKGTATVEPTQSAEVSIPKQSVVERPPKNTEKTPATVESTQSAEVSTKVLSAPDISGMTLIGQAGAIAKWYGKTIMSEEELFCAFGKSVVMKLVGEGYLVRTRKGIILGS